MERRACPRCNRMLTGHPVTSRVSGNALAFLICLERQASHVAECQTNGACERGEAITGAMLRDFGVCGLGKPIVYGSGNHGPRWIDEVEALTDAGRAALRGVS